MNKLTKRQLKFIDELFKSGGDEASACARNNISAAVYRQWLNQKAFTDELVFRSDSAKRASKILLTQYLMVAAAKLVELTGSDKEETARRACLDILSLNNDEVAADEEMPTEAPLPKISPQTASKLLKVLAEANSSLRA